MEVEWALLVISGLDERVAEHSAESMDTEGTNAGTYLSLVYFDYPLFHSLTPGHVIS